MKNIVTLCVEDILLVHLVAARKSPGEHGPPFFPLVLSSVASFYFP